ncbi:MAG: hypothetical protein SOZ62_05565 [Eubacteriales bacterium]|nr:hypothetical protein [Eubacteriales bacterium]
MKNKLIRLLCLVFALVMCVGVFAGCSDDTDDDKNSTTTNNAKGEDRFNGVNFSGKTITIAMSNCADAERVGASVAKYMTGPDSDEGDTNDKIIKAVADRNEVVKKKLGLEVEYTYMSEGWDALASAIEQRVNANDGFADAIANQSSALVRCMMKGIFVDANTTSRTNYFDLTDDCWYDAAMQAFAPGQSMNDADNDGRADGRFYLLASDYFIDVIRCIDIMYVSGSMFKTSFGQEIDVLYDMIEDGEWTYDKLNSFVDRAFSDSGTVANAADENDRLGLVYPSVNEAFHASVAMAITHSTDIQYIQNNGGNYSYNSNMNSFETLIGKAKNIIQNKGSFGADANVDVSRRIFAKGNTLFIMGLRLYDLENELFTPTLEMTPIPYPKLYETDSYRSYVHDNASVGAVFKQTKNFDAVSAYWQLSSLKSAPTRIKYYEDGLGLKYEQGSKTKRMLDIIYDNMTVDFSYTWDKYVPSDMQGYDDLQSLSGILQTVSAGKGAFGSTWETNRARKQTGLTEAIAKYGGIN